MYYVLIAGPAGAGKSTLVKALSEWMLDHSMDVARVNFDPAAEVLPYVPDVDVRRYVNARDLMVERGLGPNGALIASVDFLVNYVLEIKEEVEETKSNYALVDLPGQLEVVAFRRLGPIVLKELVRGCKSVLVFLTDVRLASDPASSISVALLALSTLYRISIPMALAVNKIDLLFKNEKGRDLSKIHLIRMLSENYSCAELSSSTLYTDPEISEKLCEVIREALGDVIPISAREGTGLDSLYASIQRVLAGGEDYLTEEPSGYY